MSTTEPWTVIEQATASISKWQATVDDPGPAGVWAILHKAGGEPMGSVNLSQLPKSEEFEIGWLLHPASTGRGYAAEAAAAIREHARQSGVTHIWAIMWPDNEASARVALGLGMEDLGVIEDPWYGSEEEPNSRIFRMELG